MTGSQRRAAAAGIALGSALLVVLGTGLWPIEVPDKLPALGATDNAPQVTVPPLAALAPDAAITAAPLFWPSRKPVPPKSVAPKPVEAPPPPATPSLGDPILLGVALSPDHPVAILGGVVGGPLTLSPGGTLNGWTVTRILPDRVVFRYGTSETEIHFPVVPSAPQAVPLASSAQRPVNGLPRNNRANPQPPQKPASSQTASRPPT
jgi:hypothetical protein